MPDLWTDLLSCLELHPSTAPTRDGDPKPRAADRPSTLATFEGPNQHLEYHRLFGGQLLGQFLRAADLACPDKAVKSAHVLFAREGKSDAPVRYVVQIQHRGRSFATLAITARQKGEVVATAAVSMHAAEDGPEHQTVAQVPPVLAPEHRVRLDLIPWETRAIGDLDAPAAHEPDYDLWMRTPEVGAELGQALIAYATDLNLIGTALRPMAGFGQRGNGTAFTSATTSHTVWFHRPFRVDDWLLMRHHSPVLAHGRCFGRGEVLTADGTLVASFAQEALLRFRP
ncbi:acyl-CoA thioesterase [Nocardia goodfellowii]|uniref:Acyl-CoA thioesterase-2 n=1 Tax=Nocardia goodfellowii TaxID=882446 RepID=A0ABS4QJS9_9NOCA|nr:acyl-CoA thioesterase domain-containing protein [Nocardia goodfellowii]MBP2191956.1 acyl-CoA thioesterase-2 [Nocardia goodfellowii]